MNRSRANGEWWLATLGLAGIVAMVGGGCGGREGQLAEGVLTGTVVGTRPVAGATVRVWSVRADGTRFSAFGDGRRSDSPIAELLTDSDGTFVADLGVNHGEILVETFGGTTEELVTGDPVELDDEVRMALVIPGYAPDERRSVVISPVTTMAEALGDARLVRGDPEGIYGEAHIRAIELIGAHFGDVELDRAALSDPTTETAGTLSEPMRYGLILGALSQLSVQIAGKAGVTANVVNSTVLGRALSDDLSSAEALFDGNGPDGLLVVGTCPRPDPCPDERCTTICDIGPQTVRGHLAGQLEEFVLSTSNVSGLGQADTSELQQALAKNAEPELFGGAPIDTDSAPLSLQRSEFFVDDAAGIWWTNDTGPTVSGTVQIEAADSVSVDVSANGGAAVPAVVEGETWQVALLPGTLEPSPAANELRVVATDGAGNRSVIDVEVRVDETPASVELFPTDFLDERSDEIDFAAIPPVHAHDDGSRVDLGAGGCPEVHKHVHLMDGGDNPIQFRFRVTDAESGLDPASVWFRVRAHGAGGAATEWLRPDSATTVTGGLEYDVSIHRFLLPELWTDSGVMDIELRGTDRLGQGQEASACWTHRPLAPPLEMENARSATTAGGDPSVIESAKLAARSIGSNLAPLVNGTDANGAGIMVFDVLNPHSESVYFDVSFTQPSVTGSKTWDENFTTSVTAVNCSAADGPSCIPTNSVPATRAITDPIDGVSNVITSVRVWDVTSPVATVEIPTCTGCAPGRFLIQERPGPTVARTYRVMLTVTDLDDLHPGGSFTGGYTDFRRNATNYTGKLLPSFKRCTDIVDNTFPFGCREHTTYSPYVGTKNATLKFQGLEGFAAPAPSAGGGSFKLDLVEPAKLGNATWTQ